MTGPSLPVPGPATELLAHRGLADRTIELLDREPTRILWRRDVEPAARVWVRVDDVVAVDDELVDPRDGRASSHRHSPFLQLEPWSTVSEVFPSLHRRRPSRCSLAAGVDGPGAIRCLSRLWQGHVAFARLTGSELAVEATDTATGEVAWRHHVGSGDLDMWLNWFRVTDSVLWLAPSDSSPAPPLRVPDPETGACKWSLPGSSHRWGPGRSADSPAAGDATGLVIVTDGVVVAGVDGEDGSVRWRIRLAEYAGLLDLHATDDHVIAFSLGFEGEHRSWLNVSVRDRADGAPRWNRWFANDADLRSAAIVTGSAVVTHEGSFLRARSHRDGDLLWALPVEAVPGMAGNRRLISSNRPRLVLTQHQSRQPWAWLRRYGQAASIDAFIHGATGQVVPVRDAFHLTADGLVLTRTDTTLSCLALPEDRGGSAPDRFRPSPSAHGGGP
jgi:outer membrane protein assembly factor BamB